ncbi:MAG: ABC transporter permease subunit [Mesorhizobium sp.]|nr:MAG: ABC transporter permease subunit [Mesorhizobium sp.]
MTKVGMVLPIVSFTGPAAAALLTGSIIVETIFSIPGVGRYFVDAALNRDYTLVMGTVVVIALFTIVFNLIVDLLCYRNPGVWKPEQFPEDYQREINEVLGVFKARKDEIIADIDANFGAGRRGMYVYQWYGKHKIDNVPEFNKDYKYIKTIAVSVFSKRESTSWHFGPLRLSLRILYNLIPVQAEIFVQCGSRKNYWYDNPLFIFDDTLFHRSVNEYDGRRYCVFVDIIRPSPFPKLIAGLLAIVSVSVERINSIFYKNWKMIGSSKPKAAAN